MKPTKSERKERKKLLLILLVIRGKGNKTRPFCQVGKSVLTNDMDGSKAKFLPPMLCRGAPVDGWESKRLDG